MRLPGAMPLCLRTCAELCRGLGRLFHLCLGRVLGTLGYPPSQEAAGSQLLHPPPVSWEPLGQC